ncbi:MAG: PH domain-containing protein [Candidatus Micrarchaeota archaeon]|nr:PH domain-containing protein [Candidatus Micrarchaeota archaeon]
MQVRRDTKEYKMLMELLEGNEKPGMEVAETRLGGGKWFGVAHAYATNSRIIIIRIYTLGVRTSLKMINYKDITEVKVERGLRYCRIHFALQGEAHETDENAKWFNGLRYNEAVELLKFMNRMGARTRIGN